MYSFDKINDSEKSSGCRLMYIFSCEFCSTTVFDTYIVYQSANQSKCITQMHITNLDTFQIVHIRIYSINKDLIRPNYSV